MSPVSPEKFRASVTRDDIEKLRDLLAAHETAKEALDKAFSDIENWYSEIARRIVQAERAEA